MLRRLWLDGKWKVLVGLVTLLLLAAGGQLLGADPEDLRVVPFFSCENSDAPFGLCTLEGGLRLTGGDLDIPITLEVKEAGRFSCTRTEGESYILLEPSWHGACNSVTIALSEWRNHNYLLLSAYDDRCGNFIYSRDPENERGQGFGIMGGKGCAPFPRFVVNAENTFLGYSLFAGTGEQCVGRNGAGNLYVRGNVGIGTTTPNEALDVVGNIAVKGDIIMGMGNVRMLDDDWIGLDTSPGRIIFDDQATDEIEIMNANVGIGINDPNDYRLYVEGEKVGIYGVATVAANGPRPFGVVSSLNVSSGFANHGGGFKADIKTSKIPAMSIPYVFGGYFRMDDDGDTGPSQHLRGVTISLTDTQEDDYGLELKCDDPSYAIYSSGTGNAYFKGNVGIGTTGPGVNKLRVYAGSDRGIYVTSNESTAIYGGTYSHDSIGIWGTAQAAEATAIWGWNSATTGNAIGVRGRTGSASGYAGYFEGGKNYFEGNVGIGTTDPGGYKLNVQGGPGNAIYGETSGGAITNSAVYGYNSGNGYAVRGFCTFIGCHAVHGENSAAGIGVYGRGGINGEGVRGETSGPAGKAVHGKNTAGYGGYFEGKGHFSDNVGIGTTDPGSWKLKVVGGDYGIRGEGRSYAVQGYSKNGRGLYGYSSGSGFAVDGWSNSGRAIYGHSSSGWAGYFTGGKGVYMEGNVGIGTTNPTEKLHVVGNLYVDGDIIKSGSCGFFEDHPFDPTREIVYVSLEGPEAGTYICGTAQLGNGETVIDLPEHFSLVTSDEGLTVQLTPIGEWLELYVVERSAQQIIIREANGKDGEFDYIVQGVRKGYENHQVVRDKQ